MEMFHSDYIFTFSWWYCAILVLHFTIQSIKRLKWKRKREGGGRGRGREREHMPGKTGSFHFVKWVCFSIIRRKISQQILALCNLAWIRKIKGFKGNLEWAPNVLLSDGWGEGERLHIYTHWWAASSLKNHSWSSHHDSAVTNLTRIHEWGPGFDPWPCSVGSGSGITTNCGVGCRHSLDSMLLWAVV